MTEKKRETLLALRAALHACPEVSGHETRTRALLMDFLRENTSLELHPCGAGFYAAHREADASHPAVALRADYDALETPAGAAHLCGHDGNAAALCGVALAIEGQKLGRSVFLLFQPAEETGCGALPCCELFDREQVGSLYGAHTLPGHPLGQVLTRPGTIACASQGLVLRFIGRPAHAAYPEQGVSPAPAVGRLLCALPELAAPQRYSAMALCTVIGCRMGEKAFGAAAERAELWLTLRAERQEDLAALLDAVVGAAQELAREYGLSFSREDIDVFPETRNDDACAGRVLSLPGARPLAEPMRWSEDFGHLLRRCPGAYFLIGAGENCPALHTAAYAYPDALLRPTVETFLALLCEEGGRHE